MKRIVRCNRNLVFFPENTHFGDQFSLDWVPQPSPSSFHIINLLHCLKEKKKNTMFTVPLPKP